MNGVIASRSWVVPTLRVSPAAETGAANGIAADATRASAASARAARARTGDGIRAPPPSSPAPDDASRRATTLSPRRCRENGTASTALQAGSILRHERRRSPAALRGPTPRPRGPTPRPRGPSVGCDDLLDDKRAGRRVERRQGPQRDRRVVPAMADRQAEHERDAERRQELLDDVLGRQLGDAAGPFRLDV